MTWILTYSGQRFDLAKPDPNQILVRDIARALAFTCRFGGHVEKFYSVAQHCVIVSKLVPAEFAFAGLLHDAAEAYVSDVVSPLKHLIPGYITYEVAVQHAIAERFGLAVEELRSPEVKHADMIALATERRDLVAPDNCVWDCVIGYQPHEREINPLPPVSAERLFLDRFRELTGHRRPGDS
jgi:hypothetical protein